MPDDERPDPPSLIYGTNTEGVAEPLTVEKLRAMFDKLAAEPAYYYEIVHPNEYKRRVRSYLRDMARYN